ncbi:MAG: peptidoglycan DD-metalloendopeptidase family protein [Syntrophothermus sp.]
MFISMVLLVSSIMFGGYFLISSFYSADAQVAALKSENRELSHKVKELAALYANLNKDIDSLSKTNNELRLAADLPVVEEQDRQFGTGGGIFDNIFSLSKHNTDINLDELSNYIENVQNKINFEKTNYLQISKKLRSNEQLYSSMPAIKPAPGVMAAHGFGMRLHPILGIMRMHEGVDIITATGSPVIASGSGVVSFSGERNGLGLCVEIDHGFGYRTVYGHLSQYSVKTGEKVKRGQLIARTGNTGLSSGPHLHYEVHHNGTALDPAGFIFDDFNLFELTAQK